MGLEWPLGTINVTNPVSVLIEDLVDPELDRKYRGPERPILLVAHNKVLVFYRLLIDDLSRIRPIHWRAWMQFMDLESGLWLSSPFDIAEGDETIGEPDAPSAADTGTGFIAVWQKGAAPDSYPDGFSDPDSDILMNEIFDSVLGVPSVAGEAVQTYAAPLLLDMPRPRRTISNDGNTYQLFHGTVHSHSVNSNCAHDRDDFLRENYRRARELVSLDFYSITDHGHQMSHFDWFLNRILCDLNEGVRGMTTFLGTEYTNADYGHQNVIHDSCDGQLFSRRSQTTPESLWSLLPTDHTIAIPHHTAEARDYLDYDLRHFNADFNRLYEIYQARGSFECFDCIGGFPEPWPSPENPLYHNKAPDMANGVGYFQDALAKGMHLGVIASPDHTGMWGITGVYAASGNQNDIFEALTARRTYGVSNAAARMTVDFRGDGHIMGEEYELTEGCPTFNGYVRTDYTNPLTGEPAQIDEVKIYRVTDFAPGENGELFKLQPGTNEVEFTFHDTDCPGMGSAAYYLRAVQTDVHGVDEHRPSVTWTSPIFVRWKYGTSNRYTPVTPCRIVDTRNAGGMIGAWSEREFHVHGTSGTISAQGGNANGCPAPIDNPLAAHINMIAVDPTDKGLLLAVPVGAMPGAGLSVNYNAIDTNLANAGTVKTISGSGTDITVYSRASSSHAVIDVLGYYYPDGDLMYTSVTPCRIVDTRNAGGMIGAWSEREFHVHGTSGTISAQGGNANGCPAPIDNPLAAHINMIAVDPIGKGNLQAFPVGAGPGAGLSVNYNAIDTNLANAGTVKTISGSGTDITVYSGVSSTHTVIDVLGYYYPAAYECDMDTDCDDGRYCNGTETCVDGTCQNGTAVVCDDDIDCTVDSCNESSDVCDYIPDNSFCDDGLFCNGAENCDSGLGCLTGSDPCLGMACDEDNDTCVDCLIDDDCDDGLFCNGAEACVDNMCQPGSDPCPGESCDDINDLCVADCEGDFEPDGDVDDNDLSVLAADFGRTNCDNGPVCEGDFDNDNDVDGSDLAVFTADLGRTDCLTSD